MMMVLVMMMMIMMMDPAGKSPNLAKVLGVAGTDEPMLPAGRVQPTDGQLVWFVDNDAAADYAAISASL